VKRGDISGCSFSFTIKKEEWTETKKGGTIVRRRQIQDVDLFDVGPVTYPAYEGTDIIARSMELHSVMFPEGVPASVLRMVRGFGVNSSRANYRDDEDLDLRDVNMRLHRAGLTPIR